MELADVATIAEGAFLIALAEGEASNEPGSPHHAIANAQRALATIVRTTIPWDVIEDGLRVLDVLG